MVAASASRSSLTRSGDTPGGATTGRSRFCATIINSSCCRAGSSFTNSITAGVSGKSARRFSAMMIGTTIIRSANQAGRSALNDERCVPQRPSSSPRSIARLMSLPAL